jgi:LCP family protein required for cell wall assembly
MWRCTGSRRFPRPAYGHGRWPLAVVDVLLVLLVGLCCLVEIRLDRVDAVPPYPLKPTWGHGQDWLLLSDDEQRRPSGDRRADRPMAGTGAPRIETLMLLHLPYQDRKPTLVDLPPDSYVLIPGHGPGSLRLAFAKGGPALLVRTLEAATHIGIEHYVEIGFGALGAMVDAVRGVSICAGTPESDPHEGQRASCHDITGGEALGYLRTRTGAERDLAERQRELVAALLGKAMSPGSILNPVQSVPFVTTGIGAARVDGGTHLYDLIRLALSLRRGTGPLMARVPIVRTGSLPGVGPVVIWNAVEMSRLARAFVMDGPTPEDLITEGIR